MKFRLKGCMIVRGKKEKIKYNLLKDLINVSLLSIQSESIYRT